MPLQMVEELLARAMGLDMSSLGAGTVDVAVRERMTRLDLDSELEYAQRATASPEEVEALIETLVVPETWFFRDREPFVYLTRFVATQWRLRHAECPLRILSVPCSSGEEPYSIAMTLIEAGLRPEQFRVDAFDISRELLRKAEEGLYSERAFRGAGVTQRARFFDDADEGYRVRPEVRASVHFAKGNLMDPAFLIGEKPYDAVFCRNVLIYQHAEARKRTIALLDRLLAENGVLFVGHAEVNGPLCERFSPVPHPGAFALTRNTVPKAAVSSVPSPKAAPKSVGTVRPRPRPRMSPTPVYSASAAPAENANLEQARFLADQGRLDEAAGLCEQLVRIDPGNASAHFLLGVVHDAAGKSIEAEECMNRAIYLDAEHHDALMHLSLLLDRRGETARADLLRRRAAKVHDRGEVLR